SVAGEKSRVGWEAVLSVADALWFGRRPVWLLAPFVRRRVVRHLTQMVSAPGELDLDFGLETVPLEADAREPEPNPAQLLWRGVSGSLRESAAALLLVVCATQVLLENPAVPR